MSINDLAIHLGYDLDIEVSPSVSSLLCSYYKPTCFKEIMSILSRVVLRNCVCFAPNEL